MTSTLETSLRKLFECASRGHGMCGHNHGLLWHRVLAVVCATVNMCAYMQNIS